jgi:hypothetical protein
VEDRLHQLRVDGLGDPAVLVPHQRRYPLGGDTCIKQGAIIDRPGVSPGLAGHAREGMAGTFTVR